MNIQDECIKIHSQYGMSEMANYKIQLLFDSEIEKVKKSYEEKLRWIPVEERMPDYGVEVFVKYEDTLGTIHPNPAYTVDYVVATSHSKKGFSIEVDYSGRTKEKVTHWHPISFL